MRFKDISGIVGIAAIMVVFTATVTCATSPSLNISTSGSGKYVVQGTGLDKVAGIDITIGYDATTMANPRVTQGSLISGMLMVATTNLPGTMRIAFIDGYPNAKSGSGTIAEITFDSLNNGTGKITVINPHMFDVSGAQIVTSVINPQPTDTIQPTNTTQPTDATQPTKTTQPTNTTQPTGGYPGLVGGTLTMSSNPNQDVEKPKAETPASKAETTPKGNTIAAAAREPGDSQPVLVASVPPSGKKITIHKSVLERFREFQGEKTPKALMALFTAGTVTGIRQEPTIALSDGTTMVKVYINLPVAENVTPNFALNGAKLNSLKIEGPDWVVEAVPDQGVYKASISVMYGDSLTEIPMIVAPRVTIGAADEALFARFLTERSSGKVPLFDLNGDGVRNYIDDYIFTANYLTMPVSKGSENATGKKTLINK